MRIYNTKRWQSVRARAIARDGARCTVCRLLGGECAPGPLHVHHIVPLEEGGAAYDLDNLGTTCATHHPMWESLRRVLLGKREQPAPERRCRHRHPTREAREICERRLAREAALV